MKDEERPEQPKEFEDDEALLEEDCCQTQEKLANIRVSVIANRCLNKIKPEYFG